MAEQDNNGGRQTRRGFLGGILILGAGMAGANLSGCGSGGGGGGCGRTAAARTRVSPVPDPPAVLGGPLNLLPVGWPGTEAVGSIGMGGSVFVYPDALNAAGQMVYSRAFESNPGGCLSTYYAEGRLWTPAPNRRSFTTRAIATGSPNTYEPFVLDDSGRTAGVVRANYYGNTLKTEPLPAGNGTVALQTVPRPGGDGVFPMLPVARNNFGQILFVTQDRRTVLQSGGMTDFAFPEPRRLVVGVAIGDDGLIAGYRETASDASSFLYNPATGAFTELGAPDGHRNAIVAHRGNGGHIVGTARASNGSRRGWLWQNGTFTLLPEGFEPRAVNASGLVVGGFRFQAPEFQAAQWQAGVLTLLDTQIASGSAWRLRNAWAVNDAGFIVVTGFLDTGGEPPLDAYDYGAVLAPPIPII